MSTKTIRKNGGFTLIEMAIVLGVLGMVLVVAAAMLTGTMETYGTVTRETETVKNTRHCLDEIARDIRESVNFDIRNPLDAGPLAVVDDVLLLTSSRLSDGSFDTDIDGNPRAASIVLYYRNLSVEGIPQLIRHQLFYAEDVFPFVKPFSLVGPPTPLNIILVDNIGNILPIKQDNRRIGHGHATQGSQDNA